MKTKCNKLFYSFNCTVVSTGNIHIVLWCVCKWSHWLQPMASIQIFHQLIWKAFVLGISSRLAQMSLEAYHSDSWYLSFRLVLSAFVCVEDLLPLFYPYLPIISAPSLHLLLPSHSLCIFSLIHIFLPPINLILQSALSFTLSFPVPIHPHFFLLLCINHMHLHLPLTVVQMSPISTLPLFYHIPPSLPPSLVRAQRMAAAHSVLSGSRRFVHSHSGFASWNTEK